MSRTECTKCGRVKPPSEFYGNNRTCKECYKARANRYYHENKDRILQGQKAYREANKDSISEHGKAWRKNNAHKKKATDRSYYLRNKDRIGEYQRQWRLENAEWVQQYQREYERNLSAETIRKYNHARRARLLSADGVVTEAEVQAMYRDQDGLCAYCEAPLNDTYEVDHMTPLSRGGCNDWSNIALTCVSCNRRKHSKTAEEFFSL